MRDDLNELWHDAAGAPPDTLDADLELLRKRFFDPVAQGKRLRDELITLQPRPAAAALPEPLRMVIDDERSVITPEGRAAIELLERAQHGEHSLTLNEADARDLESVLLDHYRRWGRHRIEQVVALLGDEGLRPPVIGVLLTLLVNRSIGPSRAILRYLEGPERDAIDEAFRAPVGRFAQIIDPGQRRSMAKERLISGWTLHEVTRRYPTAIRIDEGDGVSRVYIAEGAESRLVDVIARALARKRVGAGTATKAFDELVEALRAQGQTLAGYGMFYERPGETQRLRQTLIQALRERHAELQEA